MEEVIERLIAITVALAWVGIATSLVQLWKFSAALRVEGAGRIFYALNVSLTAWAASYLGWVLFSVLFQPWDRAARLTVSLGFALYLVVQSIVVNIALYRYRNPQARTLGQCCASYYNYLREWGNTHAPWN